MSWEAPSTDGGSAITEYRVQWKETAGNWDTPADVSEETATGTTHTITGLSDGVEYAVRVIATNSVGRRPTLGRSAWNARGNDTAGAFDRDGGWRNPDPDIR